MGFSIPDRTSQDARAVPRAVLEHALLLAVAAALVGLPVLAHLASPAAAIALCAAGSVVAAVYVRAAAPALLIFAYQFQNLFVTLVSPWLADRLGEGSARQSSDAAAAAVPATASVAGRPAQGSPA